jgi:hypothetical protein
VVRGATPILSTNSTLTIFPALVVAAPASALLTFMGSHVANLAFHSDAFAFASRPAQYLRVPGSMLLSYVDDVSGLALTLEVKREHFRTSFYLSCLWGVKLVDPRLAVRILG